MNTILGVVVAGGQARRFGSDKALATFQGRTLISYAVERLSGWCDHVVVAGREQAPAPTLPDWPHAGMGPLGGLAAALRLAQDEGYDMVLSCSVDALNLPENLPAVLTPAPACLASQPVIGLWPVVATTYAIERILQDPQGRHSMLQLADAVGARRVEIDAEPGNINTPADLARMEESAMLRATTPPSRG